MLAFGVGYATQIPALQQFCMVAMCSVFIDYVLQAGGGAAGACARVCAATLTPPLFSPLPLTAHLVHGRRHDGRAPPGGAAHRLRVLHAPPRAALVVARGRRGRAARRRRRRGRPRQRAAPGAPRGKGGQRHVPRQRWQRREWEQRRREPRRERASGRAAAGQGRQGLRGPPWGRGRPARSARTLRAANAARRAARRRRRRRPRHGHAHRAADVCAVRHSDAADLRCGRARHPARAVVPRAAPGGLAPLCVAVREPRQLHQAVHAALLRAVPHAQPRARTRRAAVGGAARRLGLRRHAAPDGPRAAARGARGVLREGGGRGGGVGALRKLGL